MSSVERSLPNRRKMAGIATGSGQARPGVFTILGRYVRILGALLRREEDMRLHHPGETLLNLTEPLVLITLMTTARYLLDHWHLPPIGDSVLLFYTTGFYAKYSFIYISRRMIGPIKIPHMRFPIEQRLDHVITHVILRTVDYSLMGFLLFTFIYLFISNMAFPIDFMKIGFAFSGLVLMAFGWGIINLVITQFFWPWVYVVPAVNRMLILFSGIFYIPDFLPPDARYILSFNPLVHAIILFRKGFYADYPDLLFDRNYLICWVVGSVFAGLVLERATRRFELR